MRVAVSFDSERGYHTTAPDAPTVTALSLAGVRKRIAAALMPLSALPPLATEERTFGIGSSVPGPDFRGTRQSPIQVDIRSFWPAMNGLTRARACVLFSQHWKT